LVTKKKPENRIDVEWVVTPSWFELNSEEFDYFYNKYFSPTDKSTNISNKSKNTIITNYIKTTLNLIQDNFATYSEELIREFDIFKDENPSLLLFFNEFSLIDSETQEKVLENLKLKKNTNDEKRILEMVYTILQIINKKLIENMQYFPDNSFDDIFIEGIKNIKQYISPCITSFLSKDSLKQSEENEDKELYMHIDRINSNGATLTKKSDK